MQRVAVLFSHCLQLLWMAFLVYHLLQTPQVALSESTQLPPWRTAVMPPYHPLELRAAVLCPFMMPYFAALPRRLPPCAPS
ncbi:hypothetical protein FKM82_008207 [Ascaphus truei]